jgi:hypothetical protein
MVAGSEFSALVVIFLQVEVPIWVNEYFVVVVPSPSCPLALPPHPQSVSSERMATAPDPPPHMDFQEQSLIVPLTYVFEIPATSMDVFPLQPHPQRVQLSCIPIHA